MCPDTRARRADVALAVDATITRGDAYGKCALVFNLTLHAQLAFDTLAGPAEEDTSAGPRRRSTSTTAGARGRGHTVRSGFFSIIHISLIL